MLTKKNVLRIAAIAILVLTVLFLGVPALVHLVHLGLAIVKLVIELAITAALLALSAWLLRKSR